MKGVGRALASHAPHSTGSTSRDLCTQFSSFPSFLTSSTPRTAVLTRPAQYHPVQLTAAQLHFSLCSFRAPWYNLPCPAKPVLRTHNLRFSHMPPPRTRTELKSSESSGQHLGSSFPGSEEAARKLRLAIYLCKAHMTHNLLWE